MTLTPEQKAELKAAAEKATQGPWTIEPHGKAHALYSGRTAERHGLNLMHISDGDGNFEANASFIATANPTTILSLLSEVERLKAALKRIASIENSAVIQARSALGESHD